ncbi:hypothetical protein [Serratia marcescens]|jgi:hypothetical protein|uniref:hypothetical protein n=1 Tax=Serratia TaxID=613 RepID=UPI0018D63D8A|nr:hypothetical protein [Serratia marcescens]MBH2562945.1 hypothetical protein [Serratia marcescens]MDH2270380.1 hypothetical protein [Serratia marcescens]MDH2278357.1 hypothetical protein [Serratia marcescens]
MLFISFSVAVIIIPQVNKLLTSPPFPSLHRDKIKRSFVLLFIFLHREKRLFNASGGNKHRVMPLRLLGQVKKTPQNDGANLRAVGTAVLLPPSRAASL